MDIFSFVKNEKASGYFIHYKYLWLFNLCTINRINRKWIKTNLSVNSCRMISVTLPRSSCSLVPLAASLWVFGYRSVLVIFHLFIHVDSYDVSSFYSCGFVWVNPLKEVYYSISYPFIAMSLVKEYTGRSTENTWLLVIFHVILFPW